MLAGAVSTVRLYLRLAKQLTTLTFSASNHPVMDTHLAMELHALVRTVSGGAAALHVFLLSSLGPIWHFTKNMTVLVLALHALIALSLLCFSWTWLFWMQTRLLVSIAALLRDVYEVPTVQEVTSAAEVDSESAQETEGHITVEKPEEDLRDAAAAIDKFVEFGPAPETADQTAVVALEQDLSEGTVDIEAKADSHEERVVDLSYGRLSPAPASTANSSCASQSLSPLQSSNTEASGRELLPENEALSTAANTQTTRRAVATDKWRKLNEKLRFATTEVPAPAAVQEKSQAIETAQATTGTYADAVRTSQQAVPGTARAQLAQALKPQTSGLPDKTKVQVSLRHAAQVDTGNVQTWANVARSAGGNDKTPDQVVPINKPHPPPKSPPKASKMADNVQSTVPATWSGSHNYGRAHVTPAKETTAPAPLTRYSIEQLKVSTATHILSTHPDIDEDVQDAAMFARATRMSKKSFDHGAHRNAQTTRCSPTQSPAHRKVKIQAPWTSSTGPMPTDADLPNSGASTTITASRQSMTSVNAAKMAPYINGAVPPHLRAFEEVQGTYSTGRKPTLAPLDSLISTNIAQNDILQTNPTYQHPDLIDLDFGEPVPSSDVPPKAIALAAQAPAMPVAPLSTGSSCDSVVMGPPLTPKTNIQHQRSRTVSALNAGAPVKARHASMTSRSSLRATATPFYADDACTSIEESAPAIIPNAPFTHPAFFAPPPCAPPTFAPPSFAPPTFAPPTFAPASIPSWYEPHFYPPPADSDVLCDGYHPDPFVGRDTRISDIKLMAERRQQRLQKNKSAFLHLINQK